MQHKNWSIYSIFNTIVQYTCVATSGVCATVKGYEEHKNSPSVSLSVKQVSESFCPAEGRVSSLTT